MALPHKKNSDNLNVNESVVKDQEYLDWCEKNNVDSSWPEWKQEQVLRLRDLIQKDNADPNLTPVSPILRMGRDKHDRPEQNYSGWREDENARGEFIAPDGYKAKWYANDQQTQIYNENTDAWEYAPAESATVAWNPSDHGLPQGDSILWRGLNPDDHRKALQLDSLDMGNFRKEAPSANGKGTHTFPINMFPHGIDPAGSSENSQHDYILNRIESHHPPVLQHQNGVLADKRDKFDWRTFNAYQGANEALDKGFGFGVSYDSNTHGGAYNLNHEAIEPYEKEYYHEGMIDGTDANREMKANAEANNSRDDVNISPSSQHDDSNQSQENNVANSPDYANENKKDSPENDKNAGDDEPKSGIDKWADSTSGKLKDRTHGMIKPTEKLPEARGLKGLPARAINGLNDKGNKLLLNAADKAMTGAVKGAANVAKLAVNLFKKSVRVVMRVGHILGLIFLPPGLWVTLVIVGIITAILMAITIGETFGPNDIDCDRTEQESKSSSASGNDSGSASVSDPLKTFVEKYGDVVNKVAEEYNIPAIVMIAQAGAESTWGTKGVAVRSNSPWNYQFNKYLDGMPGYLGAGEDNGHFVTSMWDNTEHAAYGYGQFVSHNGIYSAAFEHATDPHAFLQALQDAGYDGDKNAPHYAADIEAFFPSVQKAADDAGLELYMPTENGNPKGGTSGGASSDATSTETEAANLAKCDNADSSDIDTSDLVKLAVSLAYKTEAESKVGAGDSYGESAATPEYKKAKAKAMAEAGADPLANLYASCDRFVATVIKLTVDPEIPWGDTSAIQQYLSGSPKWQQYSKKSEAKPGDIWVTKSKGHIILYIGEYNGKDSIVHASYLDRVAGIGSAEYLDENLVDSSGGRPYWGYHFIGG